VVFEVDLQAMYLCDLLTKELLLRGDLSVLLIINLISFIIYSLKNSYVLFN